MDLCCIFRKNCWELLIVSWLNNFFKSTYAWYPLGGLWILQSYIPYMISFVPSIESSTVEVIPSQVHRNPEMGETIKPGGFCLLQQGCIKVLVIETRACCGLGRGFTKGFSKPFSRCTRASSTLVSTSQGISKKCLILDNLSSFQSSRVVLAFHRYMEHRL